MPTRVLLLRHAETVSPLIFHGAESDVELSERGRRQAQAIAPVLAAEHPHVVVSSAMRRARETATPIAQACGVPLHIEPDLHERGVGNLCGTPTQGDDGVWPSTLERWMAGETAFAPPGAESFDDVQRRVVPVWQRVTMDHAGKTIILVAHGIVCRVLLLSLVPGYSVRDWHRIKTHNVAISELLRAGNEWRAVRIDELPPAVANM
jgi:broad specificity phosphatase PhoE